MAPRASILLTMTCAAFLLADGYTRADSLRTIVERGMIAPESGREFLSFEQLEGVGPTVSGTNIAFSGGGIGTNGVYVLITEPPALPGQSDWSVIFLTLILLAAASARGSIMR